MSMLKRRKQRNVRWGASAVEFAMVAPTFIFVMAVCAEFSRMSILRNTAQNACYEAARLAMTEGATIADGIARAEEVMFRLGCNNPVVTINGQDGSDGDNDGNVDCELSPQTEFVQCRVEIFLKENAIILPGTIFGENRIIAQTSLRSERYRGFFGEINSSP